MDFSFWKLANANSCLSEILYRSWAKEPRWVSWLGRTRNGHLVFPDPTSKGKTGEMKKNKNPFRANQSPQVTDRNISFAGSQMKYQRMWASFQVGSSCCFLVAVRTQLAMAVPSVRSHTPNPQQPSLQHAVALRVFVLLTDFVNFCPPETI